VGHSDAFSRKPAISASSGVCENSESSVSCSARSAALRSATCGEREREREGGRESVNQSSRSSYERFDEPFGTMSPSRTLISPGDEPQYPTAAALRGILKLIANTYGVGEVQIIG
jgi:hypothetical protein